MEQRRALIAAMLCLAVLLVYQEAVRRLYPPPPAASPGETSENADQPAGAPLAEDRQMPAAPAAGVPAPSGAPATVIAVETELYSARDRQQRRAAAESQVEALPYHDRSDERPARDGRRRPGRGTPARPPLSR